MSKEREDLNLPLDPFTGTRDSQPDELRIANEWNVTREPFGAARVEPAPAASAQWERLEEDRLASPVPPGAPTGAGTSAVDHLNAALQCCHDCSYSLADHAERSAPGKKQDWLVRLAERYRFDALELRAEVKRLGGTPQDGGTASGALHRGWATVHGALTGQSELDQLAENERAQQALQERYREALVHPLPADVRPLLARLLRRAERSSNTIRAMRRDGGLAEALG